MCLLGKVSSWKDVNHSNGALFLQLPDRTRFDFCWLIYSPVNSSSSLKHLIIKTIDFFAALEKMSISSAYSKWDSTLQPPSLKVCILPTLAFLVKTQIDVPWQLWIEKKIVGLPASRLWLFAILLMGSHLLECRRMWMRSRFKNRWLTGWPIDQC